MSKPICLVSALVLLVGIAAPAVATAPSVVASVTGAGHFFTDDGTGDPARRTFAFAVLQDDTGEVRGQATLHNRAQNARQHITLDCLRVVPGPAGTADIALMGGVITSGNTPGEIGEEGVFFARDNGQGQKAEPDQLSIFFTLESLAPFGLNVPCDHPIWPILAADGTLDAFGFPLVVNGNIQVR